MSELTSTPWPQGPPPPSLRACEGSGMAWRLLKSDFWRLWLLALVMNAIVFGAGLVGQCFGVVPLIGGCISATVGLAMALFLQPALQAGLFYAIRQKIDGADAKVENVFAAFRWRYWESVVGQLPSFAVGMAVALVLVVMVLVVVFVVWGMTNGNPEELLNRSDAATLWVFIGGCALALLAVVVAAWICQLFLVFILLAIWDLPGKYWEPIATSLSLVKAHFWSVFGLGIRFLLMVLVAFVLAAIFGGAVAGIGALAETDWHGTPTTFIICAVIGALLLYVVLGLLMCGVLVWYHAALIYLYRSWRGQPLVQSVRFPWEVDEPAAAAPPGEPPPSPGDVGPPQGA